MTEATLSTPKNDQELFDAMNKAVSEGDTKEIDRLMSYEVPTETSPDAEPPKDVVDPPADPPAGAKVDEVPGDAKNDDKPADQDPPAAAGDPPASPAKPPETPPVLTAEQVTALQNRLHRLESDAGRVNHLQSELARLQKALKKAQKAPAQAADQPTEEQRKFQERITALRQIDPDTAETLELLNKQVLANAKATTKDEPVDDDEDAEEAAFQAKLQRDIEVVQSVHPDAVAIFQHSLWNEWKSRIPPEQLAWATSSEPGKVIVALNAFKADVAKRQAPPAPAPVAAPAATPPAPTAEDEAAKKIQAERDRKLQDTGSNRNTPIKGQPVVDKDAMFSEMYKQIQKDDHIG